MSPMHRRRGRLTLRAPGPGEHRAGGRVLEVFESPLNSLALRALADGPMRIGDLRKLVGVPAQSTLRAHLEQLIAIGAVDRLPRRRMPYSVSYEITAKGRELLLVVEALETWLHEAPQGRIELDSEIGKAAIKGLAGGWGSAIMRAIAAQPHSLTELDEMISAVNYPAIERRISTMLATGQVEPAPDHKSKSKHYAGTDWVRRAIAPLSAAGRWERRHMPKETKTVTWEEVEAAFLLALPLIGLPKKANGECTLAVHTVEANEEGSRIAGVRLVIEKGKIVDCTTELDERSPTFALGSAEAWMDAVIDGTLDGFFRIEGDEDLVKQLVGGLHTVLFGKIKRTT